jgi:micrococcal nuclease
MNLYPVGKTVIRSGNSLSAVLSLFRCSRETHPESIRGSDSHGCFTLHFANNGDERRVKSLTPVHPTDFCGIGDTTLTKSRIILTVFVLLSLLISFTDKAVAGVRDNSGDAARVLRVNDGDTVTVSINGRREKIRMIGIDAPEMGQGLWGEKAKKHLEDILYSSRNVYVEYDVERRDKYGRILAYIRTADGRSVNAEMLRDGYAVLFTFPPNVKHVDEFTSAQKQARERKVGIWGKEGLSQLPVEYRRKHPRRL